MAGLFALVPMITMIGACALGLLWRPGVAVRSVIQHFGAGVVFAAVSVELIPDLIDEHSPARVTLGVAIGVAMMVALRAVTGRLETRGGGQLSLLAALGIDILIDGLLIGVAFALGDTEGRLLALALSVEFAALGLSVAAALLAAGRQPGRTVLVASGLAALVVLGAVVGELLLSSASSATRGLVVAIGAVALLYLVTEELLTEAHEARERSWFTAVFFAGFLVVFLLETAS